VKKGISCRLIPGGITVGSDSERIVFGMDRFQNFLVREMEKRKRKILCIRLLSAKETVLWAKRSS